MHSDAFDTSSGRSVVRGACPLDCPDTCSWEVTVEGGRAVALRGTRDHPYTRGSLCAKVDKYLELLNAPDRLRRPMRRVGRKGDGRFEVITWDEALNEMAERLASVRRQYGGEAIWPYAGCGSMGFLQGIAGVGQRVWNAIGASVHEPTICSIAGRVGTAYTMGSGQAMDPEAFRKSRLILLWGTNLLTTGHHAWHFIAEARTHGAHVVAIDPVRTRTAERADEHLPVVPGTDAALALGLLHVVVGMNAHDRAYIARHTIGWEDFRRRILEYPPSRVAALTGLPAERIVALGQRLATTRPTGIRLAMGMQRHAGGGMAVRTIMTIPGVTGDWQHEGGGAIYSTGSYFTPDPVAFGRTDLRPSGTRRLAMTRLGDTLLEAADPPVMALIVCGANPVASNPDQRKVRRALERRDLFTVVIDHFQTDTADYADLVLPTTMQPEHLDVHNAYGHLYLVLNQPAVAAPPGCLPSTEIFRRLAKRMGLTEPSLFESDEDLARTLLESAREPRSFTLEELRARGWVRLRETSSTAYPQGFATPSGKIEFHSTRAAAEGFDPMPTYSPPRETADESLARRYPLVLISAASHYFLNSMFANLPSLRAKAGEPVVVLHPLDATARQLAGGAHVRIFNDRGAFEATAVIDDAVRPGVVMSPKGYWPKLSTGHANANATVAERDADMGEGAVYHDNRVQVVRADEERRAICP